MAAETMVRLRRRCVIFLWFFLFGFPQRGSAQVTSCTVTQHDDQTTYTIVQRSPDGPLLSAGNGSDCEYTWANASQHVMAHNHAKAPELVLKNSINNLTTSRCIDKVIYSRTCVSKDEHYTANCTIICHRSAPRDKDFTPYLTAFIVILVLVVLLVVGGLLVFLCHRCKISAPRCSSDQSRPGYWLVQRDADPKAADMETERRCFP